MKNLIITLFTVLVFTAGCSEKALPKNNGLQPGWTSALIDEAKESCTAKVTGGPTNTPEFCACVIDGASHSMTYDAFSEGDPQLSTLVDQCDGK